MSRADPHTTTTADDLVRIDKAVPRGAVAGAPYPERQ